MAPEVTALICVFNEEILVRRAVESLRNQTLRNIEILVVNDGSTDGTAATLAGIEDGRLRVVAVEHRGGQAAALALGARAARGRYIANLDADDEAYPERLEKQAAFLDNNPEYAWVGCGEERVDTQRGEHTYRLYPTDDAAIRRQAAKCIPYPHSGIMFRASLVEAGLNYDPEESIHPDFDFFLRIAAEHKVANLPEVLARRHVRDESFFERTFGTRRRNVRMAYLAIRAVRCFNLPFWYYLYPPTHIAYPLLPNNIKIHVRRLLGLKEKIA